MSGYDYICGTAARFRKKFPNLYERKEKKPVFIDASLLDKIEDIPEVISAELIGKSRISRLSREEFAISTEDENGYKYWLDIDCSCYDYYKNGKLIYSVLVVDGARWNIYKANIYGCYDDLPVKSGSLNWSENLNMKLARIDMNDYETRLIDMDWSLEQTHRIENLMHWYGNKVNKVLEGIEKGK